MSSITGTFYQFFSKIVHFFKKNCRNTGKSTVWAVELKPR